MPLFEFECRQCHREVEVLVRGEEAPECPECGSLKLEKLLSAPAAHTRGAASLPVCQPTPSPGGCGAPWCGTGACGR